MSLYQNNTLTAFTTLCALSARRSSATRFPAVWQSGREVWRGHAVDPDSAQAWQRSAASAQAARCQPRSAYLRAVFDPSTNSVALPLGPAFHAPLCPASTRCRKSPLALFVRLTSLDCKLSRSTRRQTGSRLTGQRSVSVAGSSCPGHGPASQPASDPQREKQTDCGCALRWKQADEAFLVGKNATPVQAYLAIDEIIQVSVVRTGRVSLRAGLSEMKCSPIRRGHLSSQH